MPNCFALTRKGETEPVVLQKLNEELCAMLGEPVHERFWTHSWYDIIGFKLAMGRSWDDIDHVLAEYVMHDIMDGRSDENVQYSADLLTISHYIQTNFTSDAWVEIGRR